jgi:hypothetical protein
MPITDREEQIIFENEVRRIARQLWPEAQYQGAHIIDGMERDGVFVTEDCIHLIEATVSRTMNKASDAARKLSAAASKTQPKYPQKAIKCWFVTKDEPTADQRDAIRRIFKQLISLSFTQFQGKLIDASSYLSLRENYAFGSIRDPLTGKTTSKIDYVPLDLIQAQSNKLWSIAEITDGLLSGRRFIVLGDFGAGKSMTLRELHRELRGIYYTRKSSKFPIYLNLRDHLGQTNPAEVLERHGRNLGFANPSHLVRAWRAGYVILLIDGFDELTTLGIQGIWKRLQDTRYRAMQVVREFIRDQPIDVGIIISGRAHFFDSSKERKNALGITGDFVELTLNEFSDEQIKRYLEKQGLKGKVPQWIPSRPLLVGYLAASGILKEIVVKTSGNDQIESTTDPAKGWDFLLDRVCAREAEIEAGIDGPTVRRILERLATVARSNSGGLGPLASVQVIEVFVEICGYSPDEKGIVLIQRLPGLGVDRVDEGTRVFLDKAFADACRAGDVTQFLADPFGNNSHIFQNLECPLDTLGIGICVIKANNSGISNGKMNAVLKKAAVAEEISLLLLDLIKIAMELGHAIDPNIQLKDIYVPSLELPQEMKDCSHVHFRNCYFSKIAIDADANANLLPRFYECYCDELEGRSSLHDLPSDVFDDKCHFDKFSDSPDTTDAIGDMDLPLGMRVLLTILRKIYLQSGSGRKENALNRGLDHHGRRLVNPILRLLQGEGIVSPYRRGGLSMTIWIPDRTNYARVARIITAPRTCNDPLIEKVANLA